MDSQQKQHRNSIKSRPDAKKAFRDRCLDRIRQDRRVSVEKKRWGNDVPPLDIRQVMEQEYRLLHENHDDFSNLLDLNFEELAKMEEELVKDVEREETEEAQRQLEEMLKQEQAELEEYIARHEMDDGRSDVSIDEATMEAFLIATQDEDMNDL